MLIPGYQEGSDITFMNSIYNYPKKNADGKWSKDNLTIIYKDNNTGEKGHVTIESPDHEFYVINEDKVDPNYQPFFINSNDCKKVSVPHNSLEKNIADITHNEEFYKSNVRNGCRYENNRLHAEPNIMNSDTNIEDHYRFRFSREYTNSINKVTKGFFDIEVDGKYQKSDFPEPGECPINCCSYLDEKIDKIYTFILRNSENPLIEEFEKSVNNELFEELHEFIIEKVGGWKQATRFGLMNTKFEMLFFDDEISLIKCMFDLFHDIDPDFILVWNMSFDIPYIIARIQELGYVPEDIMCNKNFENKTVKYYVDTRNKNDFAERTDYCNISGNITWIDQMIQFCSRRKSKIGSFTNFKLDTIGELIAKVNKLSYSHITDSVIKLPYLDFKTFVFYNIMDVIVQKCIEKKTQDIEYIFAKCIVSNTSYRKGHRQTVYLINRFAAEFYKDGFIIGNNRNKWNEKPPKFAGALVGDPLNTNDYSKIHILGRPIMVCNNLLDEDYKSLYPSITLEHNIAPNTLIGAIIMPEKVYDKENYYSFMKDDEENSKYSRSGEFIDNLVSGEIIEFSERYFHLAGIRDFLNDFIEFIGIYGGRHYNDFGHAIYFSNTFANKIQAINFNVPNRQAIHFYNVEPLDYTSYRNELRRVTGI